MHTPVYVAGLGCRRGCSAQELRQLLDAALVSAGLTKQALASLATSEHKQAETGLLALADQLGLPLATLTPEQLGEYDVRLSQRSALSASVTGSAGVAEASALACAEQRSGQTASLVCAKIRSPNATCAIARAPQLFEETT